MRTRIRVVVIGRTPVALWCPALCEDGLDDVPAEDLLEPAGDELVRVVCAGGHGECRRGSDGGGSWEGAGVSDEDICARSGSARAAARCLLARLCGLQPPPVPARSRALPRSSPLGRVRVQDEVLPAQLLALLLLLRPQARLQGPPRPLGRVHSPLDRPLPLSRVTKQLRQLNRLAHTALQ